MLYVRYNDDGSIWGVSNAPFKDAQPVERDAVVLIDGVWYDADKAPTITPEQQAAKQQAAMQAEFTEAVQQRLDAFAQTRGYDGIMSAASYATSTDPQFHAEGERAVALRDTTWRTCYGILADVLAGKREIPTLEEVFADLPALTWGDEE